MATPTPLESNIMAYIEDRLARVEKTLESLLALLGHILEREEKYNLRRLAELSAQKLAYRKKRSLKKRRPKTPRPARQSRRT